ncbi:MAG: DUF853 family protein [Paludibacteraceae bacterium]|nr:DUF853 family protein [Paludibacteraceae bacterium]
MYINNKLYVAHCDNGELCLTGKMCNRHGLIAGATGTGKTVTLQVLAETFSQAGVPVFAADMKGDLSGISQEGKMSGFIEKRCPEFGIENPEFNGCPTRVYDVFGEQGTAMRTTVSEMGPQLMARLMELNDVQTGVLNVVFRIADDKGLLLIDLKDLRLMLDFVGKNASMFTTQYGNISSASIGAIVRSVLAIESEGGDKFFGEPAFDINDLLDTEKGKGVISLLAADKLMLRPKMYSTFLLWLLSELYENLPEVGDMELPKLVFFFDEAHMLFDGTSKALTDKLEQIIRLIRSKGVGIYFVTQSPTDIPEDILGQLGNRVQHALRAFTPKDQKAVRTAAETFRQNKAFNTADAIMNLGTGEALVSFLDEKGAPSVVERAKILFPLSQIGAITAGQRLDLRNAAPARIREYDNYFDRESAYEVLTAANDEVARQKEEQDMQKAEAEKAKLEAKAQKEREKAEKAEQKTSSLISRGILGTIAAAAATSFARSMGTQAARSVVGGTTRSSRSSSKSSASAGGSLLDSLFGSATKTATNTATRKITNELLKGLFG